MARKTEQNPNRDTLLGQIAGRIGGMADAELVALLAGLPEPVTFSGDQATVLRTLAGAHGRRLTLKEIAQRSSECGIEVSTTGAHRAVRYLENSGLVWHPEGSKSGVALSARGLRAARTLEQDGK